VADLFDSTWRLPDLDATDFGPYAPPTVSDAEKRQVMDDYHARKPTRVPVVLATNDRVALLDRRISSGDLTYERVFAKPEAMLKASLLWQYVCAKRYHRFCDYPTELPETWKANINFQNVYEAWFFGCPLDFRANQVPDARPILTDENKRSVFDVDIDRPLDRPPYKTAVEFYERLVEFVADKTFLDRPIAINPPPYLATDGPLTNAMSIRGPGILVDLIEDPDYAGQLLAFFVEAAIRRRQALLKRYDLPDTPPGFADDSIALIGVQMYEQLVMPHHRRWYEATGAEFGKRGIHLCGDATRHFPTLKEELGVTSFDTGFPVDFARLRKTLGPDVEILGGVEVSLLLDASPQHVYERSRRILTSGILEGGRFIFREANNLPPNVPWANLSALYRAAFDFGRYS
jgi:uroporphyrinogen-III decarboxylase